MATMAIVSSDDSNLRVLHGRGMNVTSNVCSFDFQGFVGLTRVCSDL